MRVPMSWLREYVDLPAELDGRQLSAALIRLGLEVETVDNIGAELQGPIVIGEVREITELAEFKKPIRWCQVDVGESSPRGIICGATNFAVGDRVVVALPGAVLPGGFAITARSTYGQVSDGMICASVELGLGDDHAGILIVDSDAPIGADAISTLELQDEVLDIAITPDRGYCLSIRGVAREASHALNVSFRDPAAESVAAIDHDWPVRIDDSTGCDHFSARTVTGLDPAARTPWWVRRRLLLGGMRPISLAVDVTNYLMLALGQPMHAFDRATLQGPLVVRRAQPGERLTTLDSVVRSLDTEDLLVTDDSGPVALAGVMGGASTEISADTTDIVLEAAHWDPSTILRMERRHKLPSEAAKRFERGVDPAVAAAALHHAGDLLAKYGNAQPSPHVTVVGELPARPVIRLAAHRPSAVAGRSIDDSTVVQRLTQVGCTVTGNGLLEVQPPSWRPDLTDPADLVEEVIRLEGYDTIPSVLPKASVGQGLSAQQRAVGSMTRSLAAHGFVEVLTYPFASADEADVFELPDDDPRRNSLRILNPLSDEDPALRTWIVPGLLKALQRNLSRGQRDVALFETGLIYRRKSDVNQVAPRLGVDRRPTSEELEYQESALPVQPRHVAVVMSGDWSPAGWWGAGRPAEWGDAVAAAHFIGDAYGISITPKAGHVSPWHPGRCAELVVDGKVVGYAGELHPRIVAALHLPPRVVAMELDADALGLGVDVRAPQLSHFPPALLDVAVVVGNDVPAAEVEAALRDGAGELLESVRLFDVYSGAPLESHQKSLAYALRFRAPDRTLTVEEATAARDAAVAQAYRRTKAVLRS